MELKDFVKETLIQIIKGVKDAQIEVQKAGGMVNPTLRVLADKGASAAVLGQPSGEHGGNYVFLVDFDVAVIVEEGKETKGGIGVVTGIFSLGSQGKSDQIASNTSRIQFKVPILLPQQKAQPPA